MYGPEAFADPPITPAEQRMAPKDRVFLAALVTGVIVTVTLPVVFLTCMAVFETVDLGSFLVVWAVFGIATVWLAVARYRTASGDDDDGDKADAERDDLSKNDGGPP
jgi:hypothetical protein